MRTLIIHIDSKTSKSKIKEQLKNVEGIVSISDKLTLSDFEDLADEKLKQEMKKAD
jgi:copper chaperone CopZ